jgi:CRISPR-associated endonuclease Cas1
MTPRIAERTLVVDGYGITLCVERGHLLIRSGVADERAERRLSRIEPEVERIVVLADTGTITLDAVRWCADIGIDIVQVDRHGRPLLASTPPGRSDGRLRRAQALAPGQPAGLAIGAHLLREKLHGQADVAEGKLANPGTAATILEFAGQLDNVQSADEQRGLEAAAANAYFTAWTDVVTVTFTNRDRSRVPDHWHQFVGRRPPRRGASRFTAIDPVSALLNYLYALAEADGRRACIVMGLDPGLGVLHTDKSTRAGMVLDLIEPVRPVIDAWVLQLLRERAFTRADFHETRDGVCRLLPPLTHELAATMPLWAYTIAPHAEKIVQLLAEHADLPIRTATPLTRNRSRKAANDFARLAKTPNRTCRECGTAVSKRNTYCARCWTQLAPAQAAKTGFIQAQAVLAQARANGTDPTQTPRARQRRNSATIATRRLDQAWEQAHPEAPNDPQVFDTQIRPNLQQTPLSAMVTATGLSQSACSMIRSGQTTPHPRHWAALADLGG